MHAVLHLQTNGPVAKYNEAFEERLCQSSAGSFLVHNNWTKLLMIPDKDNLLTAKDQRDHALWFRSVNQFIHQRVKVPHRVQQLA